MLESNLHNLPTPRRDEVYLERSLSWFERTLETLGEDFSVLSALWLKNDVLSSVVNRQFQQYGVKAGGLVGHFAAFGLDYCRDGVEVASRPWTGAAGKGVR